MNYTEELSQRRLQVLRLLYDQGRASGKPALAAAAVTAQLGWNHATTGAVCKQLESLKWVKASGPGQQLYRLTGAGHRITERAIVAARLGLP